MTDTNFSKLVDQLREQDAKLIALTAFAGALSDALQEASPGTRDRIEAAMQEFAARMDRQGHPDRAAAALDLLG